MRLIDKRRRVALALDSMEAMGQLLAEMPPEVQLDAHVVSLLWQSVTGQLRDAVAHAMLLSAPLNRNDNPAPALDGARPGT